MQRYELDDEYFRIAFQSMHPIKDATSQRRKTLSFVLFQSMHPIKDATTKCGGSNTIKSFQSMHPIKDATFISFLLLL